MRNLQGDWGDEVMKGDDAFGCPSSPTSNGRNVFFRFQNSFGEPESLGIVTNLGIALLILLEASEIRRLGIL